MTVKNVSVAERWLRLVVGAGLIVLGLSLSGWIRWVSGLAGLALVLTAAFGY